MGIYLQNTSQTSGYFVKQGHSYYITNEHHDKLWRYVQGIRHKIR